MEFVNGLGREFMPTSWLKDSRPDTVGWSSCCMYALCSLAVRQYCVDHWTGQGPGKSKPERHVMARRCMPVGTVGTSSGP